MPFALSPDLVEPAVRGWFGADYGRVLAEVREHFGVRPPDDPHDGHHHW